MITRVSIRGFRGVVESIDLDLGRITLLSGRNGFGKTTIFDAIDWCFFGDSWRLGETTDSEGNIDQNLAIRNIYCPTAEPYVAVTLRLDGDDEHLIERTISGATLNGANVSNKELITHFVTDDTLLPPYSQDVAARIRRLVYLPQEDIRTLLSPEASSERVAMFQSLLGIPNASTVESGLRKVKQRLEERDGDLERQLASVRIDIENVFPLATAEAQREESDIDALLARARHELGVHGDAQDSVEMLRDLCVGEGQRMSIRRGVLEHARAQMVALLRDRLTLRDEEERYQATATSLEQVIARENETLREIASRLENAVGRHLAAVDKLEVARGELDRTRRLSIRAKLLEEARLAERERRDVAAVDGTAVHDAEQEVSRARQALSQYDLNVLAQTQQLRDARETMERFEERRRVRERMNVLEGRVADLTHRLRTYLEKKQQLADEDERAQGFAAVAEGEYERALARANALERMTTLLVEVANLFEFYEGSDCPLCGSKFESADALRSHIGTSAESHLPEQPELSQLRRHAEASRAEASAKHTELVETARQATELEALIEEVSGELRRIQGSLDSEGEEVVELQPQLEAAEARLSAAEHERDIATQRLADLERKLGDATVHLRRAEEELEVIRGRVATYEREIVEVSSGLPTSHLDLTNELNAREEAVNAASREVEVEESQQAEALAAEEGSNQRLADARERLTRVSERHRVARERVENLEREIGRLLIEEARLSIPGDADLGAVISDELERAIAKEQSFQEAVAVCDEVVARRERDQASRTLAVLSQSEQELLRKQERLRRARRRFGVVADTVETRLQIEAQLALQQHKATIQECFSAIYPHTHLNVVNLVHRSGDILLSDSRLQGPVHANLYASTGQLNALALAIFFGIGLRQRLTVLNALMLDEPVQNLDDIRFLSFITLVKRVAWSRQVMFSTADANVAEVFRRQMRSSWATDDARFVEYQWVGFEPERGPEITRFESLKQSRRVVS